MGTVIVEQKTECWLLPEFYEENLLKYWSRKYQILLLNSKNSIQAHACMLND